jgi:hypothetical protein
MQWNLTKCNVDGDFTPLVMFDHLHKVYKNDTDVYRSLSKSEIAFFVCRLTQQDNKRILNYYDHDGRAAYGVVTVTQLIIAFFCSAWLGADSSATP